mmetsp:Transcript_85686/g.232228  ORF Transcript_85686/g.232228 Transcript_85686/m.232228 type:complete len:323 (+) Transcript_85686:2702-3670(+)
MRSMTMTTRGRPWGIIATARSRPRSMAYSRKQTSSSLAQEAGSSWYLRRNETIVPVTMTTAHTLAMIVPSTLTLRCNGFKRSLRVWPSGDFNRLAIRPISVDIPVAVTWPTALPETMSVDLYSMFSGYAESVSFLWTLLVTSLDSPVSTDSLACRSLHSSSRMSAGTMSPMLRCTMSPGTRSATGKACFFPSRTTTASSDVIARRAAEGSCPEYSPTALQVQTMNTRQTRNIDLTSSPVSQQMMAAREVRTKIRFPICVSRMLRKPSFCCASSSLGPNWCSRRAASAESRPASGSVGGRSSSEAASGFSASPRLAFGSSTAP